MKNLKSISPIVFAIIILVIFSIIALLPIDSLLAKMSFTDFQAEYLGLAVKMTFVFAVSYRLVKKLNIESVTGLSSKYRWSYKYLNLIPVYLIILGASSVLAQDFTQINIGNLLLLLFACMAVGFAEEFLFRGVLQSLFLKKYINFKNGLFLSVFFPALIFGLFHLVNLTKGGDPAAVMVQAVFATFIGFFFGVIVLKTNKIIPVAITHGLINFFFSLAFLPGLKPLQESVPIENAGTSFAPIILTLPLFIIGLIVIRKIKKDVILTKLN